MNARGPDLAPLVRCRPLENRGSERRSAMDAAIATKLSEDLARVDFGRERRRELSTPRPGAVRESRATSVRLATFATLARLGRFGMSATRKPRFRRGIRDPRDASRARPSISGDHAWNRSLPATCELRSRRCPGKRRKHSGLMGLSRVARSPSRSQVAVPSSCGQFQITPVRSRVRVPHRPLARSGDGIRRRPSRIVGRCRPLVGTRVRVVGLRPTPGACGLAGRVRVPHRPLHTTLGEIST